MKRLTAAVDSDGVTAIAARGDRRGPARAAHRRIPMPCGAPSRHHAAARSFPALGLALLASLTLASPGRAASTEASGEAAAKPRALQPFDQATFQDAMNFRLVGPFRGGRA